MKLDQNNPDGRGKYWLIRVREVPPEADRGARACAIRMALKILRENECLDYGDGENEFFVIRLKDKNAGPALSAYADSASENGDEEFADQVEHLSERAFAHPNQKQPD